MPYQNSKYSSLVCEFCRIKKTRLERKELNEEEKRISTKITSNTVSPIRLLLKVRPG
jgi:hypothetical protein